jgi:hypothetical protein
MIPTPVVPPTSSLTFSTGTQERVSGKRGGRPVKKTRGLFKYRNSKYWWIRYAVNGDFRYESTRTADVTRAREILKAKRAEIAAARAGLVQPLPGADARRATVSQLAETLKADYVLKDRRSIKGITSHLKQVTAALGEIRVTDLRAKDLTAYQMTRKQQRAAGGTINQPGAGPAAACDPRVPGGASPPGPSRRSVTREHPRGLLLAGRHRGGDQAPALGRGRLRLVRLLHRLEKG